MTPSFGFLCCRTRRCFKLSPDETSLFNDIIRSIITGFGLLLRQVFNEYLLRTVHGQLAEAGLMVLFWELKGSRTSPLPLRHSYQDHSLRLQAGLERACRLNSFYLLL